MCVEEPRSVRKEALFDQIDHALHGFTLVDRVGDHGLGAGGQPNRVIGLRAWHAIGRIGIVRIDDDLLIAYRTAEFDQFRRVVDDLTDLCAGLLRRSRGVDTDHAVGAVVRRKADDHAALGRTGNDADDDVIEGKPEFRFLGPDFLGEADIAEPAIFVYRCAGRYSIGDAALIANGLHGVFPALANADVEPVIDDAAVGAHQTRHQNVADAVVNGVVVRHPAFLYQPAFHADLGGRCRDHPGVVGLYTADGNQGVGAGRDCVRNDIFQLAQLVAAHGEAGIAVVALGIDLDFAAACFRQTGQMFDRRRTESEGVTVEFFKVHICAPVCSGWAGFG